MPNGQFGTRAMGGKDAASARYIHTKLNTITRFLYKEEDDHILQYLVDDGQLVEPKFYLPIIPMILVNGAEGIGTGWSTFIPNYNPRELVQNILNKLNGGEIQDLDPFYKNYNGTFIKKPKGYDVFGKYEVKLSENLLNITELPINEWTRKYKNFLEKIMMEKDWIKDYREYHKTDSVDFEIFMDGNKFQTMYEKQ